MDKPDPMAGKWRSQNKWNNENRRKRRAQAILRTAIRKGQIVRGACEVCGSFRVDGHHDDYALPLVVRWFCRRHTSDGPAQRLFPG